MRRKKVLGLIVLIVSLVVLTSPAAGEEDNAELGTVVVTPLRMAQYGYEVGSNVTIIGADKIAASGALTIAGVLREEAGLHIYDSGTDKTVRVDIRGFADTAVNNILVLIDGRRVNAIDTSGPDWIQIPKESVERIEVVRGASSVLYGDNAVGGVVNIVTKKGKGKLSVKTGVAFGSYQTEQEDLEVGGSSDKWSYYLYSRHSDTRGYRSNSHLRTKDFNARLAYQKDEMLSIDLAGGWHEDDYGMPGGLDDITELAQLGRRGSTEEDDFASTKDRYLRLSLVTHPYLKDVNIGKVMVDTFYRNRDTYSWFYYGGFPTATKYMIDTRGLTVKNVWERDLFGRKFNLLSGLDYYDVENIIKGSEWSSDDLTIFKEEVGFYTYSEYELSEKVSANAGARYQKADYRFDQRASSTRYETRHPRETVFLGGLRYNYGEGSSLHLNIQDTFRFLATDEWFNTWTGLNTNLKHQQGRQYELGLKHNFADRVRLTLTPYWIDIEDEIYINPTPPVGQNENYGRTRRKGIECDLRTDLGERLGNFPLDRLEVFTNYTYQQPEFRGGDYSGKDIPMVPRHQAKIGANLGFAENYNLALVGRYTGERYAINDTGNATPGVKDYFVLDGQLSYERDSCKVYLALNNIFAEKYYTYVVKSAATSKKDYYPAPERSFIAGINYRF